MNNLKNLIVAITMLISSVAAAGDKFNFVCETLGHEFKDHDDPVEEFNNDPEHRQCYADVLACDERMRQQRRRAEKEAEKVSQPAQVTDERSGDTFRAEALGIASLPTGHFTPAAFAVNRPVNPETMCFLEGHQPWGAGKSGEIWIENDLKVYDRHRREVDGRPMAMKVGVTPVTVWQKDAWGRYVQIVGSTGVGNNEPQLSHLPPYSSCVMMRPKEGTGRARVFNMTFQEIEPEMSNPSDVMYSPYCPEKPESKECKDNLNKPYNPYVLASERMVSTGNTRTIPVGSTRRVLVNNVMLH